MTLREVKNKIQEEISKLKSPSETEIQGINHACKEFIRHFKNYLHLIEGEIRIYGVDDDSICISWNFKYLFFHAEFFYYDNESDYNSLLSVTDNSVKELKLIYYKMDNEKILEEFFEIFNKNI